MIRYNLAISTLVLAALASMPVLAQQSPALERVYFQIFPNYFPIPNQDDKVTKSDNSKTRIMSRYKLHPNSTANSKFDVRNEPGIEGKTQKIVEERNGNEFLFSMSCHPDMVKHLEERKTLENEIKNAEKEAYDYTQSIQKVLTLPHEIRADLAVKTFELKVEALLKQYEHAQKGTKDTFTIIGSTDKMSLFGIPGTDFLPIPCVQVSNIKFVGCPNTPIEFGFQQRDTDKIRELRRELDKLTPLLKRMKIEWTQANKENASKDSTFKGQVRLRIAFLNKHREDKRTELKGLVRSDKDYRAKLLELRNHINTQSDSIAALEELLKLYDSTVVDMQESAKIFKARVAKKTAEMLAAPAKAKYENAVRECSASMKMIPLPVGAIVGALAKKVSNVSQSTAGLDPDEIYNEGAFRYFVNSQVSFYHPAKLDVPISLSEVDLAYMPPWLLPVEEMRGFKDSFVPSEFIQMVNSRFSVITDAFKPPIGVSSEGGASLGSYPTRLFMETRILNQNNEFPDEPVKAIEQRAFALDTYDKLVRSIGTWGYIIKSPTLENPAVTGQTLTNTMMRDIVLSRPLKQNEFMSKDFAQAIDKLRNSSAVAKSFSDWKIAKYAPFLSHESNPHVRLSVEFGLIRRQHTSARMCFQYVKDAMLLSNLVDERLEREHAQQAIKSLEESKWQIDTIIHPPLSFVDAPRTESEESFTVASQLAQDFSQVAGLNQFRDILNKEGGILREYCKLAYGSVGVEESSKHVQYGCYGRGSAPTAAQRTEVQKMAESKAQKEKLGKHPLYDWFAKPQLECLAPYGSTLVYAPLDDSKSGHIENKTEEIGKCGFVSDHFSKKPISERLRFPDGRTKRQLKAVMILNSK